MIKENSHCIVQEKCAECAEIFDRLVSTKGYFKNNYPVICPQCKEKVETERIERKKRYIEEQRIEFEKFELVLC